MGEREDRQDIAERLLRYATGIDRRDGSLFRTVFYDDELVRTGDGWRVKRRQFTQVRVAPVGQAS